jgi:hypothetical protein
MMNARRLWSMTGGAVSGRVEEYAKYSAEQQSAQAGLGLTSEYTGAGADVIRQKNNLTDFERANQKAAWNTFSPLFNAVSGAFGGTDPNKPGLINYASNNLALGVGLPIAAGFAGSIAGMAGMGTIAGVGGAAASTGLAGGLTGLAGAALPAAIPIALGLTAAQALGEPIREEQNFGMAATEKIEDFARNFNKTLGAQTVGTAMSDEEWRKSKETRWYYGKQSEAATLGDTVSAQTDNKVSRELATNLSAMVAKTTGLSYEQLNTKQGQGMIAQLGLYPDQQGMQQRFDVAQTATRLGGAQFGSDQYMKTVAQAMDNSKFTNKDVLKAQETAGRVSNLAEVGRGLGVELPELGNLEFLANATPQQKMQAEKIGRFDQRTWSNMARQMLSGDISRTGQQSTTLVPGMSFMGKQLIPETTLPSSKTLGTEQIRQLITTEANGLQPLGTLTTGNFSQVARQTGLQGIGYTPMQAMTMPLMSTAQIESQQRNVRDTYQQFQNQQQLGDWGRNQVYALGGKIGDQSFAGSFNLQAASQAESVRHSRQQMAFEGGTVGGGYGWMNTDLKGLKGMSVTELGGAGLNYKQALEAIEFQKKSSDISRGYQREDAQISWQRGTTQNQWQGQDLLVNFNRSMEQFNWSLKDLNTNFQRGQQGFQWQQQGLNLQANQSAVNFGWQVEDIDTAMRYSTGRERRQLTKQRERAATSFGFTEQGLNLQQEQLTTKQKWAGEDFTKETSRLEERRKWAEQDFEKEKSRLETRQEWLDEDLERALKRIGEQAELEDEQLTKRRKDLEDELKLNSLRFKDNKTNLETIAGIQKKQLEDSIKQFKIDAAARKEAIDKSIEHTLEITELSDAAAALSVVQKAMFDNFAFQVSNPDGPVPTAMRMFVQNATQSLTAPDDYSLLGGFKLFVKAALDSMKGNAFAGVSAEGTPELPRDYTPPPGKR